MIANRKAKPKDGPGQGAKDPVMFEGSEAHPFEPLLARHGACRNHPDWFAPDGLRGGKRRTALEAERLTVCEQCPVIEQCRLVADHVETAPGYENGCNLMLIAGVWGGETPGDRVRRRKREREIHEHDASSAVLGATSSEAA